MCHQLPTPTASHSMVPSHQATKTSHQGVPGVCLANWAGKIWQVVIQPQIFPGFFWYLLERLCISSGQWLEGKYPKLKMIIIQSTPCYIFHWPETTSFLGAWFPLKIPTVSWVGSVQDGKPLHLQGASKSGHLMCEMEKSWEHLPPNGERTANGRKLKVGVVAHQRGAFVWLKSCTARRSPD